MNERIKELIEQSNTEISYRVDPHSFKQIDDPNGPHTRLEFSKEKFAELIVLECADVAKGIQKFYDENNDSVVNTEIWTMIKHHFGVEE
jgi:hypothetical protein